MDFKEAIKPFTNVPLSRQVILSLLKGYKRPNDKISELIRSGDLISLKKGLYIAKVKTGTSGPEPFLVANHLWGPSYVSLDSALSYWGLIPERVFEVSSITMKLSKKYKTQTGRYSYRFMPSPYYSFGIKSIELSAGQVVRMATPEKALCDKIITTTGLALRSPTQTRNYLLEDLRIDQEVLHKLNFKEIKSWIADAPKKESIRMLVKTLEKL